MTDEPDYATSVGPTGLRVALLGSFQLSAGRHPITLPVGSQHLLAFLALRDRSVTRSAIAGTLWPDVSEAHAFASLRSALSRLDAITRGAVQVKSVALSLAPTVAVDIRESRALAHRLLTLDPLRDGDLSADAITALSADLLPDWYDDWAVLEAEEWRQLRLHALEALGNYLLRDGRFGDAAGAALAAMRGEPLRESAQALMIRVHLAEGNQSEALAAFDRYSALLRSELGLAPTPLLQALVRDLRPG
jgi:DNA-binding SARP family transcriptional activator